MRYFPHGLGEALGDPIVTGATYRTSGEVWYVHHTGSDTYNGRDRVKPKATVGAAAAAASAGDTIVMLSGHTESITTSITVDVQMFIVGAGSSGGVPTVVLTRSSAAAGAMFSFSGSGGSSVLGSIKFAASSAATTESRVYVNVGNVTIRGCYFECGDDDLGAAVLIGATGSMGTIEDTTFISTATIVTAQPKMGVQLESMAAETAVPGWKMNNVTFDGGAAGFSNFAAYDDTLGHMVYLVYEDITLANGADMAFAFNSTGLLNVDSSAEGGMVDW